MPVCPKHKDIAYNILEELGASEEVLKKSYKLYNIEVQNKRNIFFNKKLFNKQFGIDQDCTIDIVLNEDDENSNDDDDIEKEEQEEETPGGRSDINVERVREISEELEFIESRLQVVKKQKVIMEKKVEYCRACCSREYHEEEGKLTPPREENESLEQPDEDRPISADIFATIKASMAANNDSFLQNESQTKTLSSLSEATWSSYGRYYYTPFIIS